jgi:hypothetical protein
MNQVEPDYEQNDDKADMETELLENLLKRLLEIKLAEAFASKQAGLPNAKRSGYFGMDKRNPEFTNSLILYSKLFKKLERIGK